MAEVYDLGRTLSPSVLATWMDAAAPHVPAGRGGIIDLGAGTGRFSRSLAERFGGPVMAIEPAGAMRTRAVRRDEAGPVWHLAGRAQALPIRSGSVRAVWASQVLHHVDDLAGAAAELVRVLAPGGCLLVRGMYTDLSEQWPLVRFFPGLLEVGSDRFPSWEMIRQGLESGGLVLVTAERIEQVVAGGLQELLERTRHRADSGLAMLEDEQFDEGLAALAAAARSDVAEPVREVLDLLVFSGRPG